MGDPESRGSRDESMLDGLRIERSATQLRITRHWPSASGWASLAWVAVWFGLVGFFLSLSEYPAGGSSLLLALPGIAMTYVALARFFNHTQIGVDPSRLIVRHAPLPWPGSKHFATRDVSGLHVETRRVHAKGNPYDECWIFIVRQDGRQAALLKGLEMSDLEASRIAAAMSGYLGVPVTGGRC